jgi:hypothetical protein
MPRTQKLYDRLDNAEAGYSSLLRAELEAVLGGCLGHYLGRKLRDDWHNIVGRQPDERAVELDVLEKVIRGLRLKLGEPVPGEVVGVAVDLVTRIKETGNWSPGTNKAWLNEAISILARQASSRDHYKEP